MQKTLSASPVFSCDHESFKALDLSSESNSWKMALLGATNSRSLPNPYLLMFLNIYICNFML
jgi:hypothetical protein